jgi:hypothetical protein
MAVQPSHLSSEDRSDLQVRHGVCWNTDDDEPTYFDIQQYHRDVAEEGLWYLPFHDVLKHECVPTEVSAYEAAGRLDRSVN